MHCFKMGLIFGIAAATVLLTAAPQAAAQGLRNEDFKLLPHDGGADDVFGISVAISGSTAIVGAEWDNWKGRKSGSAYLFDVATGTQIAKLLPRDGAREDLFGGSVAISGSTAIVGAYQDDDNRWNSGSAYLFDVTTGAQVAKLLPSDGERDDRFGISVAISGSIAIVGTGHDDDNGRDSGSAYLFDVATGTQIAKLLPGDGAAEDWFGRSVAISGSTAIVGAGYDDDNGRDSGSAYLFDVTTAAEITKLLPSDGAAFDFFGRSVAISESTAIVGAHQDDDKGSSAGSAYLFDVATGAQIAKLLASDGAYLDEFGISVAISGSTAIVGAHFDMDNGWFSGSAYLFDAATGTQIAKLLPSDGAMDEFFGFSVAICGETAIAGAPYDNDNGEFSGSAYLFDASGITPPMFTLQYSGDCPGIGTFTVTDATPGGRVVIVSGFGDGPTTIPITLPCAGTVLDVGNPNLANRIIFADPNGVAVLKTNLPTAACGRVRVQALDLTTCDNSDVVRP